jgi:hypothetical protein
MLKAGTIFRRGAIDCTVRNLSDAGAALDVISPVGIPDRFTLVVDKDQSRLPCPYRKSNPLAVCTENSNPDVMMVKPAEDWA